jgi:hypothetical protein
MVRKQPSHDSDEACTTFDAARSVKLHTLLDLRGNIAIFILLSDGIARFLGRSLVCQNPNCPSACNTRTRIESDFIGNARQKSARVSALLRSRTFAAQ